MQRYRQLVLLSQEVDPSLEPVTLNSVSEACNMYLKVNSRVLI